MARMPTIRQRWSPPPSRAQGDAVLKMRESRDRRPDAPENKTSAPASTGSLAQKVEKLDREFARLLDIIPARQPGGGGGKRSITRALNRDFIIDDPDLSVAPDKLPTRGNVKDYLDDNYTETSDFGTAAFTDTTDYATSAQGTKADSSAAILTPISAPYTGEANYFARVNLAENALLLTAGPVYNVRDYGATGNGVTDDLAAINLCIAAASANTGLNATPKGRGTVVFPVGNYQVSDTVVLGTGQAGIKVVGMGASLYALTNNVTPLRISGGSISVYDLQIVNSYRPTVNIGTMEIVGGADCLFSNITISGGYIGLKLIGGGDSAFYKMKINACFSDFVFLEDYNGMWCTRGKFDGSWPVSTPTSGQIKGVRSTSTAYTAGDVITSGNFYYQCAVSGTSSASASVLLPNDRLVAIVDGTAQWYTHRTTTAVGINLGTSTFIHYFANTDVTGGHIYSVRMTNTLAKPAALWAAATAFTRYNRHVDPADSSAWLCLVSHTSGAGTMAADRAANPTWWQAANLATFTAPQSIYFTGGGTEFGLPLLQGLLAEEADNVHLNDVLIDGGISSTSIGINLGLVRNYQMSGCVVHGYETGVAVGLDAGGGLIRGNHILGGTTGINVVGGVVGLDISGNWLGSTPIWGANATAINFAAGATDYVTMVGNHVHGASVAGIVGFGAITGTHLAEGFNL